MSELRLDPVNKTNIVQFQALHKILFPVTYSNRFYAEILNKYGYYGYFIQKLNSGNEKMIIGIASFRIENDTIGYLMTFGVVEEERHRSYGRCALKIVENIINKIGVSYIYLHVHIANLRGRAFYERNGYILSEMVKNYYKNIQPCDAYMLTKVFHNS